MKTQDIFSAILGLIVLIGLGFLSSQYLNLRQLELKNNAVNGCMQYSGYTELATEGTGKSSYPLKDIYTVCMADKGYSTLWK
jgi:hypothetical protein